MKTTTDSGTWGIKGGGFGLYGYLPALCKWQQNSIYIEKKHQASIEARSELRVYQDRINWVQDEAVLLDRSECLVLCVPPFIQQKIILENILKKYRFLILEKPIATSPSQSNDTLNFSIARTQAVRIGYSLLQTPWANQLIKVLSNLERANLHQRIDIKWHFLAHHIKNTDSLIWKSQHDEGGGVLRFYGIHLIAVLAKLSLVKNTSSSLIFDQNKTLVRWLASFQINQTTLNIDVDSGNINEQFLMTLDGTSIINQNNPFSDTSKNSSEDNRIPFLMKILSSTNEKNIPYYLLYKRTLSLWLEIEQTSKIVYSA